MVVDVRDATALLGDPASFTKAWRSIEEALDEHLLAHPASEQGIVTEVPLADDPAGRRLFVRRMRLREATAPGAYLALVTDHPGGGASATNLYLAAQVCRLRTAYRRAAHDLRAPLNAIAIHMDMLRDDVAREDSRGNGAGRRIDLVQAEVARLSSMLQTLLAETPPKQQRAPPVPLRRLLSEVIALVAAQAHELGIGFAIAVPRGLPSVIAARDPLKQALLNLMMNAIESMPDGGVIEVAAGLVGRRVAITIRDHGCGIAASRLQRIFSDPSTDKPGGSGIGLASTRAALAAMSGSIRLSSTEGIGTTARIELPMAGPDRALPSRLSALASSGAGGLPRGSRVG